MTRYGETLEISNSEIQTYLDCKRRWWLSYYRGLRLKAEAPIGPLSIGSRVHNALEQGYSSPGREAAMRRVLAESIEKDYPLAIELDVLEQFEKECELALIMLEGFVDWAAEEGLDAGWEVLSEERIVRSPTLRIASQDVVLKGKLDQIVKRDMDDSVWMRDWKTTQEKAPIMMAFKPQIKTYLLLLQLTEPDSRVSGAQIVFLRKVKRTARAEPPFYMQEQVYISSTEMESFWKSLLGVLSQIVETDWALGAGGDPLTLAPARPTRDCSWRCPYYSVCDMFDDGSDIERYLDDLYVVADPYAYYDDPDHEETEA